MICSFTDNILKALQQNIIIFLAESLHRGLSVTVNCYCSFLTPVFTLFYHIVDILQTLGRAPIEFIQQCSSRRQAGTVLVRWDVHRVLLRDSPRRHRLLLNAGEWRQGGGFHLKQRMNPQRRWIGKYQTAITSPKSNVTTLPGFP